MTKEELTYASAGVDRDLRSRAKKGLERLEETYIHSKGGILHLPYGNLKPTFDPNVYQDHKIEGVGTKVLLAQLADKYDTIGIDGAAMAVMDIVRSGARPDSIADNIDAERSDSYLVDEWTKGLVEAAHRAEVPIVDGEIADVAALVRGVKEGKAHHIVCSCVGYVNSDKIIYGKYLKPGDPILGLRSSGLRSNGISLVRKTLFAEWGGYYKDPFERIDELDGELILETLKPTDIYSREVLAVNEKFPIRAAVHITGDAHMKFDRLQNHNPNIGFEFNDLRPHPIFPFIQKTASKLGKSISNLEMARTFNLGDGFDIVVDREYEDGVLDCLERMDVEAWRVGLVNDSGRITAVYNGEELLLK